jgi:hypothetical protein
MYLVRQRGKSAFERGLRKRLKMGEYSINCDPGSGGISGKTHKKICPYPLSPPLAKRGGGLTNKISQVSSLIGSMSESVDWA